jgi:hypothetical protein
MAAPDSLGALSEEFSRAELGHRQRTKRVMRIASMAEAAAGASLPSQAGGYDSVLEGTYRFFGNPEVEPEAVLGAHQRCTVERASRFDEIVVPYDTTSFEFKGEQEREGLGPLCGHGQGMYAHYALALSPAGEPLGVLGLLVWRRNKQPKPKLHPRDRGLDEDRESLRWHDAVHEVIERLEGKTQAIHVMDREADAYELLADLREHEQRFVVRVAHDRLLAKSDDHNGATRLYAAMASSDVVLEREVNLSRRKKPRGTAAQRINPARKARVANLRVRAGSYEVARAKDLLHHVPAAMMLNFVEVTEPNPPEGQEAVLWRLVTSEPISTPEEVARVIDIYRMRWGIEEFFKSIKTGCNFEKLQLTTGRALVLALAVYSAVAWRLLLVRWMEREHPLTPGASVVTPTQLILLGNHMRKIRRPWTGSPTSREVLLAIAALGGHLRRNGPPGWLVLSRGFHALLLMEEGWNDAHDSLAQRSDQ